MFPIADVRRLGSDLELVSPSERLTRIPYDRELYHRLLKDGLCHHKLHVEQHQRLAARQFEELRTVGG